MVLALLFTFIIDLLSLWVWDPKLTNPKLNDWPQLCPVLHPIKLKTCVHVCKKFFINYGKWLQQSRNVHYAALKTFKLLWFPTLNRCVHLDPTRGLTVSCALLATRCHTGDCHPKQFSRIVPDRLPWPKIAFFLVIWGDFW